MKGTYNNLIGAVYALDELKSKMLKWNKISYLKNIVVLLYMCFILKMNPFKVIIKKEVDLIMLIILFYFLVYILFKIRG